MELKRFNIVSPDGSPQSIGCRDYVEGGEFVDADVATELADALEDVMNFLCYIRISYGVGRDRVEERASAVLAKAYGDEQ